MIPAGSRIDLASQRGDKLPVRELFAPMCAARR
jgi:hypothetical protein